MPVIDDDPAAPPQPTPASVQIAAPEFKTVVVDTRYEPVASLLTNIQGASWIANYFSQILASDSQVSGQQPTLDPLYQAYTLVKGFELKVTSPLATQQDETTKTMKLTGSANVYPFLIPNVGDMFIADIGDGREGIFKVNTSDRRSIFKDTCYSIEYELVSYADKDRSADLYSKVQRTLQFVKDFLMHGQNPLLELSEYELVDTLASRYHELVELYFRSYVSRQFKTTVVPGQEFATYDHFLTQALPKFFSTWDATGVRQIRAMNLDDDPAMGSLTLWDVLLQQNSRRLQQVSRTMQLVSARAFARDPMLEGIYWTGLVNVVYPADPTVTVNLNRYVPTKPALDAVLVEVEAPAAALVAALTDATALGALSDLLDGMVLTGLPYGAAPLLTPVLADNQYVLSQAFYDKAETGQSQLELAVWDYLQRKPINRTLLLALCDSYASWGTLERFYYLPIVLVLIKASIRYL